MSDKNISIYRDGVFKADIRALDYTNDYLSEITSTYKLDTILLFHNEIIPHELSRNSDTDWTLQEATWDYIPKFNYTPDITTPAGTMTPSAVEGKITLTAGVGATFVVGDVGQKISGGVVAGGRARIIKYLTGTTVEALTEVPFYTTDAIATGDWSFLKGFEDIWSVTRGYPTCGTYFQQRLLLGGFKSLPSNIAATQIDQFFNFDPGTLRDSDGYSFTLDKSGPIVNLLSHNTLQIFTTDGEITIPQSKTLKTTPLNLIVSDQTGSGSEKGLAHVIVDDQTLFIQREGKSIGALVFVDERLAYRTENKSIFSSHLIDQPVDFALRKSSNIEEASYLLIVNQNGNLTFACVLAEQQVNGFTNRTTDGSFTNAGVDGTNMYAVVQREIDGVTNKYIEKFDFDFYTDAATQVSTGLPATTFTGLDHLEGKECRVRGDGTVRENVTVVGGSVTLEEEVTELFEIGLNFDPEVITLPYADPQQAGNVVGKKKRISEAFIRLMDTAGLRVNDYYISFREFGGAGAGSPLDAPAPIYSGDKSIKGLTGWDGFGQLTITQVDPLPMTVLGITTLVKVSS